MQKNWYAIYVASRQEKRVAAELTQKGIENYLPLVKSLREWSDRKKLVEFPLLPGYVFTRIGLSQKDAVLQTSGVVAFVKSQGKPGIVRENEIEALKQLISLGYQIEVTEGKKIETGDKISITSGALKNLEGVVLSGKDGEYFEIYLEGIGYNIKVKLPAGVLKKIS